MRYGRVIYLIGKVMLILGSAMLLPLILALFQGSPDRLALFGGAGICLLAALALLALGHPYKHLVMRQREAYLFVTLTWVAAALFGGVPYFIYGCQWGGVGSFIDCVFESVSGFTTTGATVLQNVEIFPQALLLWRSLTHWLGGAGIVLLFVALIQNNNSAEGLTLYRAEYSGGMLSERMAVRIEDNAKLIFYIYFGLTLACFLVYLICGMSFFDSVNHALSTVATGGFSVYNASIAHYNSPAIEWAVALFMVLCSLNFSLFYVALVRRDIKTALKDQELKAFALVIAFFTLAISLSLHFSGYYSQEDYAYSLRQAFFQTSAIISTGGFCSANYDIWPHTARGLLFLLLFIGGCSGSTASGVKISRILIVIKGWWAELRRTFRPQEVRPIFYNTKVLSASQVSKAALFISSYLLLLGLGSLLLMMDKLPWLDAISAAAASLGNVGPGYGMVGIAGSYAGLTSFSKLVCCFLMLIGRLEIFTVLVLFVPDIWKK